MLTRNQVLDVVITNLRDTVEDLEDDAGTPSVVLGV